ERALHAPHRALERRRRDTAPLPPSHDARVIAQSPLGGAGLESRTEDARGPLLSQPAGPADGGGGLDPVCRGERRPNGPADRVLVATGTGGGEPPREVPAAIPAAVARIAGRVAGVGSVRRQRPLPPFIAPRLRCRRSGDTWR